MQNLAGNIDIEVREVLWQSSARFLL